MPVVFGVFVFFFFGWPTVYCVKLNLCSRKLVTLNLVLEDLSSSNVFFKT